MISVYNLKPRFQQLLVPVLKLLHGAGITANMITVASIALSLATGLAVFFIESDIVFVLTAIALLLRMALNALDGMMARTYKMQSRLGEVLNEVGDVISDVFMFFPFLKFPFFNKNLLFAFIILSIINEFSGLLGKALGGQRRYDGPMGKSDRALLLGLGCLLFFFFEKTTGYANHGLAVAILLLLISTFTRFKKSLAPIDHP